MTTTPRRWGLTIALALAPIAAARAGEPPTAPVLRVEAGMHTARIWHLATDAWRR